MNARAQRASAAPARLPPVPVIEAALRTTTARLLAELSEPCALAPEWNDFEWAVARAVCAMQGITGILYSKLRWSGPTAWQAFLDDQREHIGARAARIRALRAVLDARARRAGIPYIGLKGCALLDLGLYEPAERPMSDIDVLVRPADLEGLQRVVATLGYRNLYTTDRHAVFGPGIPEKPQSFGEHRDHPVRIELHPRVYETLPAGTVDITRRLWPPDAPRGENPYASRAALLAHLLLLAAGSMRLHVLRAMHLCDIARVARTLASADWEALARGGFPGSGSDGWWMYPPLVSAECLLPGSVPHGVLQSLRRHCPPWLRRRMERNCIYRVSWSNPKIPGLPGLEWCRSPRDVVRLVRNRLWSDGTVTKPKHAEPHLLHYAWYDMSRAERLVRWVFTRPARTHTLYVVSTALEP